MLHPGLKTLSSVKLPLPETNLLSWLPTFFFKSPISNVLYLMAYGIQHTRLKPSSSLTQLFLCASPASWTNIGRGLQRRRSNHLDAIATPSHGRLNPSQLSKLPILCPGCGAFTQTISPEQPGFYGTNRKSVRALMGPNWQCAGQVENCDRESKVFKHILGITDVSLLSQIGLDGHGRDITKG